MCSTQSQPAGLYVHIPFCIKKCPYCDFYSITDLSLKETFIGALMQEMHMNCDVSLKFDTLYIGGGTPSVFGAKQVDAIIEKAYRLFKILPDTEITIEINPGTVKLDKLKGYKSSGINRINIGVQSFQDKNLSFLGRIHSSIDAKLAIKWARKAGFDNIGLDLIYGIPGQSEKTWLLDLKKAVEFGPEHLSCYMLTYEQGTPLDKERQKGGLNPMDDSLVCNLFETTIEFLSTCGYAQYEISNFAQSSSNKSRHNWKYWSFIPYMGFGPSAHSFLESERCWNCRSVKRYIKDLNTGKMPVEEREVLSKEQRMIEAICVGLRKTEGIDIDIFNKKFGVSFNRIFGEIINNLKEKGYIQFAQNRCSLSIKGMLFLDSITSMFVSYLP